MLKRNNSSQYFIFYRVFVQAHMGPMYEWINLQDKLLGFERNIYGDLIRIENNPGVLWRFCVTNAGDEVDDTIL